MKPVTPIQIITYGIVVLSKGVSGYKYQKIEILYDKVNPNFSWDFCRSNPSVIWQQTTNRGNQNTLFVYTSSKILEKGFYKIVITAYNSAADFKSGSLLIGLTQPKDSLYIGVPYSNYDSIVLS